METRRLPGVFVFAVVLAITAASATLPARADNHFKIYAGPAYVAPMSDSDVSIGAIEDTLKAEDQVGWNFGVEFRPIQLFGIELDYVNATQDVTFGGGTIGDTTFSPLTATLNFHIVPTKIVDIYLGPSYSYVDWGEIHVNGGNDIPTDKSHSWGASFGIDIGIGNHFAICGGVKYLDVDLELSDGQHADVKPLVGRLSAAFRF